MRTSVYLVGLVIVLTVVMVLVVGCPKPPPETGPTPTGPAKTPTAEAPKPAAPAGGGDLASILGARKAVTSYVMTMTVGGKPVKQAAKLQDGKPVRMKMDTGKPGSFMLMEMDKQVNYMYDAAKKTAIKMPVKPGGSTAEAGKAPGAPDTPDLSKLEAMHPKISSATLDGLECWVLEMVGDNGASSQTWVDKQYGLVRCRRPARSSKLAYDKISAVPDSEFELPPGTKIVSIPRRSCPFPSSPRRDRHLSAWLVGGRLRGGRSASARVRPSQPGDLDRPLRRRELQHRLRDQHGHALRGTHPLRDDGQLRHLHPPRHNEVARGFACCRAGIHARREEGNWQMERVTVTSSNIKSIGYDGQSRILEVEFLDGAVYEYYDVPAHVHAGLMSAQSHGAYFCRRTSSAATSTGAKPQDRRRCVACRGPPTRGCRELQVASQRR